MNIKVCGITTMKQLNQLEGLGVDFAGLIFHKKSPRYAGHTLAASEVKNADLDLKTVGVFVNETYEEIMKVVEEYKLDAVQLHGDESPYLCGKLADQVEVIKAFGIGAGQEGKIDYMVAEYDEACDYYLFDTKNNGASGGTGEKFDWKLLKDAQVEKPFFLSGGIGPNDIPLLREFKHPDFYGIDINSQFEKSPGIKDMALLLAFTKSFRRKG
ncbi:MAG: phosphoribosylanthranilate isomerase [Ferruginibacter sp.]